MCQWGERARLARRSLGEMFVWYVPGFRPAAPKRNALVLLGYFYLLLLCYGLYRFFA